MSFVAQCLYSLGLALLSIAVMTVVSCAETETSLSCMKLIAGEARLKLLLVSSDLSFHLNLSFHLRAGFPSGMWRDVAAAGS